MEQNPNPLPTVCRPGQALGAGQEWVLERLLHRDPAGEVWLAHARRGAQSPRAFRIFTGSRAREWLTGRQGALWTVMHRLWSCPNVVRLLDVGAAEQGPPSVAMEYVPGGSLRAWLSEAPGRRPPLPGPQILGGVASALAEAHRQGITHGSLSAAEVLLTRPPDVRAKVAGFGLGGAAGGTGTRSVPATAREAAMYRPPEAWGQVPGDPPREPASDDVFAFGVIGYQLLSERLERPPYDFADVLSGAGHDPHLVRVITRCLAGPGRRFAGGAELEAEFAHAGLPRWPPTPDRCFDVSQIVREYVRGEEMKRDA